LSCSAPVYSALSCSAPVYSALICSAARFYVACLIQTFIWVTGSYAVIHFNEIEYTVHSMIIHLISPVRCTDVWIFNRLAGGPLSLSCIMTVLPHGEQLEPPPLFLLDAEWWSVGSCQHV
jgi:hypothetical protein